MAPFVRYDGLSLPAVKQAMQEFVFNINVPTRVGFQTPFTNLTMDLTPPSTLADEPVIIGGELMDATYGEFQTEMDMLNRAFAEVMLEGDAKGRVFTFPIPTYNIGKDFDWDNPELDPIWQMTARYGIPYFANFVNSDMSPEDARSMCCRLRLDNRELRKRMGGLFAAAPLTGSVGVVTMNMARLGHLARNERDFRERLETPDGGGADQPGDQAQDAGVSDRTEALSVQPPLPPRHQGPVRQLLGQPLLDHRAERDERGVPQLPGCGHR